MFNESSSIKLLIRFIHLLIEVIYKCRNKKGMLRLIKVISATTDIMRLDSQSSNSITQVSVEKHFVVVHLRVGKECVLDFKAYLKQHQTWSDFPERVRPTTCIPAARREQPVNDLQNVGKSIFKWFEVRQFQGPPYLLQIKIQ